MVRKFKFMNEKGEEFDLMDIKKHAFFSEPKGLGYSMSYDFLRIGDDFITNSKSLNQSSITGRLYFSGYNEYQMFIDYIEKSNNIYLYYYIPINDLYYEEYYKEVIIRQVTKGEKEHKTGHLISDITINGLENWKKEVKIISEIGEDTNEIRWNFIWNSHFSNYNLNSFIYNNTSHTEIGYTIEILGEITNPIIEIFSEDGKVLNKIEYIGTINKTEKLKYSTLDTDICFLKYSNDEIINLYNSLSLEHANFAKLPKGISKFKIKANNEIKNITIKIYPEYKTV